jgi:protein-disulfide isomerase
MKLLRNQKTLLWSLLCSGALLVAWALLPGGNSDAANAASSASNSKILATVGGQPVTQADVEARLLKRILAQQPQLLDSSLEEAIQEKLVELEAAAQKTSKEQLIEREVAARSGAVTDAEVDAFFEQNKARIPPNMTKEQVVPQIRNYLTQQRKDEVTKAFYASLGAKYAVTNNLTTERQAEEIAKAKALRPQLEVGAAPFKGPATAPVTIVEFSDFQCPFCSRVLPAIDQTVKTFGDKVRFVFRQFPLESIHPMARKAAEASLCAADQGKFWELHDAMFADQKTLEVAQLKEKAVKLGIDGAKFNECLDGNKFSAQVQADLELGNRVGVRGTPAIYVNGRFVDGAVGPEVLAKMVNEELARSSGK